MGRFVPLIGIVPALLMFVEGLFRSYYISNGIVEMYVLQLFRSLWRGRTFKNCWGNIWEAMLASGLTAQCVQRLF